MPAAPRLLSKRVTDCDLAYRRLRNQRLVGPKLAGPDEVVAWLTAVQAQDYGGAKWALSMRTNGITDAAIDDAFNAGTILRTHVMRPTWHFVTPSDIRWMLALTAPRVHAVSAYYYRKHELDSRIFARAGALFERALEGGKQLTRVELAAVLGKSGIRAEGSRLGHLMMRAELDAIVCSGPRRGKQFTYALLDDRAPTTRTLGRDESLAELARRYFSSHGPATLKDYVWWSGLTARDAKAGIAMAKSKLVQEVMDGRTYWFAPTKSLVGRDSLTAHLLPNYDEHLVAYKDRAPLSDAMRSIMWPVEDAFPHYLVVDGQLVGTWRRRFGRNEAVIEVRTPRPLKRDEKKALAAEGARYGRFINMPVTLSLV